MPVKATRKPKKLFGKITCGRCAKKLVTSLRKKGKSCTTNKGKDGMIEVYCS